MSESPDKQDNNTKTTGAFGSSKGLSRSKIKQVMPYALKSRRLHGGGYEDGRVPDTFPALRPKYHKEDLPNFALWYLNNFGRQEPEAFPALSA